jgi:hypothetical protein
MFTARFYFGRRIRFTTEARGLRVLGSGYALRLTIRKGEILCVQENAFSPRRARRARRNIIKRGLGCCGALTVALLAVFRHQGKSSGFSIKLPKQNPKDVRALRVLRGERALTKSSTTRPMTPTSKTLCLCVSVVNSRPMPRDFACDTMAVSRDEVHGNQAQEAAGYSIA